MLLAAERLDHPHVGNQLRHRGRRRDGRRSRRPVGGGQRQVLGAHADDDLLPGRRRESSRQRVELQSLRPQREHARDPVRLVFTAGPGPGVVVTLSDVRNRFRLVANVVELVPPSAPLPKLPVGRAVWRPAPRLPHVRDGLAAGRGGARSACMTTAVGIEAIGATPAWRAPNWS
jgi:L-arabinose isomerase